MLEWKTPETKDVEMIRNLVLNTGEKGSDISAANIFLLREKYHIQIAVQDGFLFRSYTGTRLPGRKGVALPAGEGDIAAAVRALEDDRKERGLGMQCIFLTEKQKETLMRLGKSGSFVMDAGNTDYLYTAEHLAQLSGKRNHKKKNRVKHFMREYPDWKIRFVEPEKAHRFAQDMIEIEEKWFAMQEERIDSSFVERLEIYDACRFFKELSLLGAVLYVEDFPVAMTIASEISKGVFDIHFEKCYGDYARAGGFAAINQMFAEYLLSEHHAVWINREEDIGLEGLRRAKMSYHPDFLLEKYHGVLC